MLRLRTTTTLSALALAIGIAGSAWLCTFTDDWAGPPGHHLAAAHARQSAPHATRHRVGAHRWHGPVSVLALHQPRSSSSRPYPAMAEHVAERRVPPLIPLSTIDDASQPWYQLRDHLNGQLLVHLRIDGRGQVVAAGVAESSGDPILDRHALRSVRKWRFRVPPAWPEGFSGDLPMRFTSPANERVASAR